MANGNRKPASEYYNDPVKYTGDAGSQTNPYCIEDVWDLKVSTTTTKRYFILVNDINFNDHPTYKHGFTESGAYFDDLYSYLDGQGHKIMNAVVYTADYTVIKTASTRNVEFANCVIMSVSGTANCLVASQDVALTDCVFGVYLNSSSFLSFGVIYAKTKLGCIRCTFNIKGTTRDEYTISFNDGNNNNFHYQQCLFNFNIINIGSASSYAVHGHSGTYKAKLTQCGIIGRIYHNYISGGLYMLQNVTCDNVYVALKIDSEHSGYDIYFSGATAMDVNIVDYEVSGRNIGDTTFRALTTQQAQDASYLQSIGFLTT